LKKYVPDSNTTRHDDNNLLINFNDSKIETQKDSELICKEINSEDFSKNIRNYIAVFCTFVYFKQLFTSLYKF
jgi:hypothetical protein